MASCPSCGAERASLARPCDECGAAASAGAGRLPELELDLPRPAAKAASPPKAVVKEQSLELAVDLHADRQMMFGGSVPTTSHVALAVRTPTRGSAVVATGGDVSFDARLLADYGRAPESWLSLPFYAWRVLRRQGELKAALAARRGEAERTAREAEDALVGFAGRVRAALDADADKAESFAAALIELRKAEDVLRSRDSVLATEQDAHTARLGAVAVRLGKLEGELSLAQAAERKLAIELATSQAALSREETKLKRVEVELRAAQRREESGDGGADA